MLEKHASNFFDSLAQPKESSMPKKRLVLFVDINRTIIVTDIKKGVDKRAAVLLLLAEKYSAIWDEKITKEKMSFKDFVAKHISPNDATLRHQQYTLFMEYLKNKGHIEILKQVEDEFNEIMLELEKNGPNNNVFPAFIELIENLEKNKDKIPYTIVLRTLGHDLKSTVEELQRRTSIKFVSHAKFDDDGYLVIDGDQYKKSWEEIRSAIKPFEHGAWLDNHRRWSTNNFIAGGKPYPLDIHDENIISVFWDDNIGDEKRKIIAIQLPPDEKIPDYKEFEQELIKLKYLVPIQTLEAIKDKNYFIKLKDYSYDYSTKNRLALKEKLDELRNKEKGKLFLLGMFFDQGSHLNRDLTEKIEMQYSKEIAGSIMGNF